MIEVLPLTKSALTRAHHLSVRAAALTARFRLAAALVTAALAAFAVDVFFPLPAPVRAFTLIGGFVYCMVFACRVTTVVRNGPIRLDRAARLIEGRHPELDSALINAVQFGESLADGRDDDSGGLMRREIARAESAAMGVQSEEIFDHGPARFARRRMLWAAAAAIASLLLFPRAWRFEAPRFLVFWQDHPPFTLTDFTVSPGDAHMRAGGSLPIEVTLGGLTPESLSLVVRDNGRERALPLMAGDGGTYSLRLEGLTDDTTYFVRANTGRSRQYAIRVDRAPEVQYVKASLTPPSYTHKGLSTVVVGREGITGLNGTVVDLEVGANRPIAGGTLRIVGADGTATYAALTPDPARAETTRARFTLQRDAVYQIDLRVADGLEKKNAAHGKIVLLRDEKPLVYITSPGQNAVVPPDMTVVIRAEAEDDVAVRRIQVHRIVNNMTDSAQEFPVAGNRPKADATVRMDLKDLGARPGDVIQYYASAYDNDPGKTNLTDSERYWLWVVSNEDYRKIVRQQRDLPAMTAEYRAQTDALRSLAERQRALANRAAALAKDSKATAAQRQALRQEQSDVRKEAQDLADSMRKLAHQQPQYDAEGGLQQKLRELANSVEQAAGPMKQAESAQSTSSSAQESRRAAQQLEKASGQGQRTVEKALQAMEKLAPLYEDLRRLQELAKQQADIAMLARQLAGQVRQDAFQQSRMRELAQRQTETRRLLDGVRKNLLEHAGQCEADAPHAAKQARDLGQALDRMSVSEQMGSAASALDKQQSQEGAANAENARRSLEQLFQQSKSTQGAAKSSLDKQLGLCLGQGSGNSLQQLSRGLSSAEGQGGGQGQGFAQGQGDQPAPQPGSQPGHAGATGGRQRQAAAFTTLQQQQAGRSEKRENRRHLAAGESPAALGSRDVERLGTARRPPEAAVDSSSGRYPAEYRRLVKDYFRSVAGGGK